jgi:hypothetical protein
LTRFAFNLHRLLAGAFLLVFLFAAADSYFELGFFGQYAKGVVVFGIGVVVIYGLFLGPTRADMREHGRVRKAHKGD